MKKITVKSFDEIDILVAEHVTKIEPMIMWNIVHPEEDGSYFGSNSKKECDDFLEETNRKYPEGRLKGCIVVSRKEFPCVSLNLHTATYLLEIGSIAEFYDTKDRGSVYDPLERFEAKAKGCTLFAYAPTPQLSWCLATLLARGIEVNLEIETLKELLFPQKYQVKEEWDPKFKPTE